MRCGNVWLPLLCCLKFVTSVVVAHPHSPTKIKLKNHTFKSQPNVAELPRIQEVQCSKTLSNLVADLCLSIDFHDSTMLAALQKVHGNSEVYEGLIIDALTSKGFEDSQISLTIEDGKTFVSLAFSQHGHPEFYHLRVDMKTGKVWNIKYNNRDIRHMKEGIKGESADWITDSTSGSMKRKLPKQGMTITIQPFYDAAFKAKFGDKSKSTVDKIVAHAKSIFAHVSLTTVVFVKALSPILHDPNTVLANEDAELAFGNRIAAKIKAKAIPWAHLYTLIGVANSSRSGGIAPLGSVCGDDLSQILAHEMGHGLGMEHDFGYNDQGDPIIDANGKTVDRPGKNCTKADGFMDYSINPKRWSHCSVEDFTKYYNKWYKKKGKFCLPLGNQAGDKSINRFYRRSRG